MPQAPHPLYPAFHKALRTFGMVRTGSRVLIGLSGGKDSLALLHLFGILGHNPRLQVEATAVHVRMRGVEYESDLTYLHAQAEAAGIPLLVRETERGTDRNSRRTPCFLCAWQRRKVLFEEAQRLSCDALALGHHEDDLLRTALLNLTFAGRFDTMRPVEEMQKFPLRIIRPMCFIPEQALAAFARERDFQPLRRICPYDKATHRTQIDALFRSAEEQNPDFRASLRHAVFRLFETAEASPHKPQN